MPESSLEWFWVFAAVGGIAYGVIRSLPKGASPRNHQGEVEARFARLMVEFPQATNAQVTVLVHDELVTAGERDKRTYAWCVEDTAARVRRNIVLSKLRSR